ncbi:MAG: YerC/YecD family TrpR-related protein [Xanthomonadaceae bacterium]|nr:YerC/YecD family TrpR-related protein [Xanthomonadaceae bacterium]
MKRPPARSPRERRTALDRLADALLAMQDRSQMRALLTDLCTPAEIEAMADRWQVVAPLLEGVPYREIHERTGVSVTTVGRVARSLTHGAGGYLHAAEALGLHRHPGFARTARTARTA